VIVGIDGSAGASEALRWAAAEARLRKTRLRLVHAWTLGYGGMAGGGGFGYLGGAMYTDPGGSLSELHKAAEEALERTVSAIAPELEGLEIERVVVEGGAAEALLAAAGKGDLLVVGSRGHGGFAGLLLGSISQQCAHHAPCPVVIVHPSEA
jgi:nucleotide-binding universal stress UspA family protein